MVGVEYRLIILHFGDGDGDGDGDENQKTKKMWKQKKNAD